jgi:hypothetical protein
MDQLKAYLPALKLIGESYELGQEVDTLFVRNESGIYLMSDMNEAASFGAERIIYRTVLTGAASSDWIASQIFSWAGNSDTVNDRWFLNAFVVGRDTNDDFAGFAGEPIRLLYRQYTEPRGATDLLDGGEGLPVMTFDTSAAVRTDYGGTLFDSYICVGDPLGGPSKPVHCGNGVGWIDVCWYDGPLGATDVYHVISEWAFAPKGIKPATIR